MLGKLKSPTIRKKGNLCCHEQSTHRETLIRLQPGSYKTARQKKFNLNKEMGPHKKSRNKEVELTLENLLVTDEEPDTNAMIDLTVANEQYLERDAEGTNSKHQTKQRVQERCSRITLSSN